MAFSKKQIFMVGGGVFLGLLVLVLILLNIRNKVGSATLTVWGFDNESVFDKLRSAYVQARPGVKINYKKVSEDTYDKDLLEALALDQGPDIFLVRSGSLLKDKAKLTPVLPDQFTLASFRDPNLGFPQVVEQDFVSGGRIYALPLYLDTLALFYNKDLFDQAAVVYPPTTWKEFQALIPTLIRLDERGQILRAAAAIGGSTKTLGSAADLLNLLMFQNGVEMFDQSSRANFTAGGNTGPGARAFQFYLQFSNPVSQNYTWNDTLGKAFDSFSDGKTAMTFGYYNDLNVLKRKNPFLNVGVAMMPQVDPEKSVNFANYVGWGVSRKSRYSREAWDFIVYGTTNPGVQKIYFQEAKRPPALKALIAGLLKDPELGVFARQALTARSWPRGDAEEARRIFGAMIDKVLFSKADSFLSLQQAEEEVSKLMREILK